MELPAAAPNADLDFPLARQKTLLPDCDVTRAANRAAESTMRVKAEDRDN